MSTPVITKRQQKQTLASTKKSAKKTPAKGVRNVLAQPYERYWPVVSTEDGSNLDELLDKLLPGLRRQSQSVPWALLRKMKAEERLAAQKKTRSEAEINANNTELLKSVTMGVNAVTRELEGSHLCSVLLDSTVESLLIKHVVVMAQNQNIPILLVPFLKKSTLQHIKFASAAMGLRNNVIDASHPLHEIHQEIVKLCEAVPSAKAEISLPDEPEVSSPVADKEISMQVENTPPINPLFSSPTSIYKYRSSRKERTFVPPNSQEKPIDNQNEWSDFIAIGKDEPTMEMDKTLFSRKNRRYVDIHAKASTKPDTETPESGEFIAFDSNNEETSTQKPKKRKMNNSTYVPLKVRRIHGNNNRVKATKLPKQKKKGVK